MSKEYKAPTEGDLYKIITVGGHRFELRYGYYADFERSAGDPVVIYPNLMKERLYTPNGELLACAMQEPCMYYNVPEDREKNDCCADCVHYYEFGDEIGICSCQENRKEIDQKKFSLQEKEGGLL